MEARKLGFRTTVLYCSWILVVPFARSHAFVSQSMLPWSKHLADIEGLSLGRQQSSLMCTAANSQKELFLKRLGKKRRRLDEFCVEKFPQYSRNLIQSWIMQGKVLVDGKEASKAGMPVSESSKVDIIAEVPKYVCRGGYKLEAAIKHFGCDMEAKTALDSGLSTGGFTDCLLQHGASRVYGVDVGYGQVAEKIRTDKRVCIMERTNLRYLTSLPESVDIVTLDLSFISILTVMPAVCALMKPESSLITLVKPQFEASRKQVGSGGIVRDKSVHKEVLDKIINGIEGFGFVCEGWIESPIKGADGNVEFLAYFIRRHTA